MTKGYKHLSADESAEIRVWHKLKKSPTFIRNKLKGRACSTIRRHMSNDPPMKQKRSRKVSKIVSKRRNLVYKYVEEYDWEEVRWKCWEGQKREVHRTRVYVKPLYPNASAIRRVLFEKHNIEVRQWTVWNDLRFGGYLWRKREKVVTMNPEHWEKRLTFCKEIRPLLRRGELLLWYADECAISMAVDSTMVFHYRHMNQPCLPRWVGRASGKGEKVHIWACIGPGFRRMVMFDTTVTMEVYVDECLGVIWKDLKRNGATLIHDNASAHGKDAKDFLEAKKCLTRELSPYSPDLNVIEQLWMHLKKRVFARYPTRDNFKKIIAEEFAAIPQSIIDGICESFPKRVDTCIENKGKHFKKRQ